MRNPKDNLVGPPVKNFFKGHFDELVNETKRRGLPTVHFEREILQTYGKVALMWLYHIPILLKEILVTKNYPKSELNYFVYAPVISLYGQRFLGTGLGTNMNEEDRKIKRRLIDHVHAFLRKYLKLMVPRINSCCDILINKLSGKADGKTQVYMLNELSNLALDVICKVGFGVDLDEIKNGGDDLPLNLLRCILKTCESDNETITMENLTDEFVTFSFAGHDTTSSLLSSFLMELSDHPKIEE